MRACVGGRIAKARSSVVSPPWFVEAMLLSPTYLIRNLMSPVSYVISKICSDLNKKYSKINRYHVQLELPNYGRQGPVRSGLTLPDELQKNLNRLNSTSLARALTPNMVLLPSASSRTLTPAMTG